MGAPLILKCATASPSSGEWNDDDYDVLADATVVGRIMKVHAAPEGSPWMWTLAFSLRPPRGSHADTRLCRNARGCDGRVRQELAAGIGRVLINAQIAASPFCGVRLIRCSPK